MEDALGQGGGFLQQLTLDYFNYNADQGIQRGECSHRGADRFLPERGQHRPGAGQTGSRRSGGQAVKSVNHFYQQKQSENQSFIQSQPSLLIEIDILEIEFIYRYQFVPVSSQYLRVLSQITIYCSVLVSSFKIFQIIFFEIIFLLHTSSQ